MSINVLVIAHPDDESMFFVPTLVGILKSSCCWIVCLTTGDYDGLGETRQQELQAVVQLLSKLTTTSTTTATGIISTTTNKTVHMRQLHHPDHFPDHPRQKWDIPTVAQALETILRDILLYHGRPAPSSSSLINPGIGSSSSSSSPKHLRLFTFDETGVSGHWNHRDTYFAVQHVLQNANNNALLPIESAWCLMTIQNPIQKYFPVFEWIRLLFKLVLLVPAAVVHGVPSISYVRLWQEGEYWVHGRGDDNDLLGYRLLRPALNWQLMMAHWSQFVWYRRLFVLFSCYTYCNKFRRMR